MAVDPTTRDAWHEALAERDREVHAATDDVALRAENEALGHRLDVLQAEVRVQREAVRVRDQMLRDMTTALRERDLELAELRGRTGATPTPLARARRFAGRFVRRLEREVRALAHRVRNR